MLQIYHIGKDLVRQKFNSVWCQKSVKNNNWKKEISNPLDVILSFWLILTMLLRSPSRCQFNVYPLPHLQTFRESKRCFLRWLILAAASWIFSPTPLPPLNLLLKHWIKIFTINQIFPLHFFSLVQKIKFIVLILWFGFRPFFQSLCLVYGGLKKETV